MECFTFNEIFMGCGLRFIFIAYENNVTIHNLHTFTTIILFISEKHVGYRRNIL